MLCFMSTQYKTVPHSRKTTVRCLYVIGSIDMGHWDILTVSAESPDPKLNSYSEQKLKCESRL